MKQFLKRVKIFLRLKMEEIFSLGWVKEVFKFLSFMLSGIIIIVGCMFGASYLFSLIPGLTFDDGNALFAILFAGTALIGSIIISFKRWICDNWKTASYILKHGGNKQCSNCGSCYEKNYCYNEGIEVKPDGLCHLWTSRGGR